MSASTIPLPVGTRRLSMLLSRGWWRLLIRGLAAIAFGIVTWTWPGLSLAALIMVFAIYAIGDGVFGVWTAVAGRRDHEYWWLVLVTGLLGIAVGVVTLAAPGLTALVLVLYIAIWAIAKGGLEMITAIRLRKEIEGEWFLLLGGAASVLFGAYVLAQPGGGALVLLWLIGAYAMLIGVLLVLLALKARALGRALKPI